MEIDGQLKGRHIVVTKILVPLIEGPKMISPRLSIVEVGARRCCSRRLLMVTFVLK